NRLWCRLAIPLLWEDPFSIPTKNYNFIEIYLHDLNDDFKTKLNEYEIINKTLPSNILFNYTGFLKYMNIYKFINSIEKWFKSAISKNRLVNLSDICVSLFETFIENEVNLHTFEIEILDDHRTCNDNILELILKNTNFIYNIRNLNLYIDVINNLKKVFERLNVLESVHIYYCRSLNTSFTQQIINLTKPFKLKSLFMCDISQIESLLQKSCDYLENFGVNNIELFDLSLKQQLLKLIATFCKNIKFLDFNHGSEIQIIYQLLNLIENINKQNLSYLSINIKYRSCVSGYCSIILPNLGQILPPKLEYLCLIFFYIKASDFEVFLKNSQDTFIKKLLINHTKGQAILTSTKRFINNRILSSIKEYIMKKKRVKYLAIKEASLFKDLISFKDEVNEFRLYNIEVKSYDGMPGFCTCWTFKGIPDFLHTLDFKGKLGTPGFCTHWTF
ncbi:hypothetical protein RhiirC2_797691, partial [Rhizophagus irregularis]